MYCIENIISLTTKIWPHQTSSASDFTDFKILNQILHFHTTCLTIDLCCFMARLLFTWIQEILFKKIGLRSGKRNMKSLFVSYSTCVHFHVTLYRRFMVHDHKSKNKRLSRRQIKITSLFNFEDNSCHGKKCDQNLTFCFIERLKLH